MLLSLSVFTVGSEEAYIDENSDALIQTRLFRKERYLFLQMPDDRFQGGRLFLANIAGVTVPDRLPLTHACARALQHGSPLVTHPDIS